MERRQKQWIYIYQVGDNHCGKIYENDDKSKDSIIL